MEQSFGTNRKSSFQVLQTIITPIRCLYLALGLFIAMVSIGAVPGRAEALSSVVYDKALHMAAYGLLASLIYLGLNGSVKLRVLHSILAVAALGGLDEAIQSLLSYRHANVLDWQYNMLGALVCIVVLSFWQSVQANFADERSRHIER